MPRSWMRDFSQILEDLLEPLAPARACRWRGTASRRSSTRSPRAASGSPVWRCRPARLPRLRVVVARRGSCRPSPSASALAAPRARATMLPALFSPSVSTMITLDLRVGMAQPVERHADAVADRGAVAVDDPEVQLASMRRNVPWSSVSGDVGVGLAPEHHQADAIGRAPAHEVLDHRLGRLEPVGHEVGLLHRARQIERDHDVDALELEVVGRRACSAGARARRPPAPPPRGAAPSADRAGARPARAAARRAPSRASSEERRAGPARARSPSQSTSATAGGISASANGCAKRNPSTLRSSAT